MAGQYEQCAGPSPTGGAKALEQRNATPMLDTRLTQSSAVAVVRWSCAGRRWWVIDTIPGKDPGFEPGDPPHHSSVHGFHLDHGRAR